MDFLNSLEAHRDWLIPATTALISGLAGLLIRLRRKTVDKHQVFSYLYEYINNYIPNWQGQSSRKALLIKRVIKVFSVRYRVWLKDMSLDKGDWTGESLMRSYKDLLNAFESEIRNDGVPEIFIQKWRSFTQHTTDHMYHYLKQCVLYPDEYSRKFYLLTMSQMLFFSSMHDLNCVCATLNGELDEALRGK